MKSKLCASYAILAMLVALSTSLALAAGGKGGDHGPGNSSDAVYLDGGKVSLLDLELAPGETLEKLRKYAAAVEKRKHLESVENITEQAGDSLRATLDEIAKKSRDFANEIHDHISLLRWDFVVGENLPSLDDDGVLRKGLRRKQLAIQFDDRVLVNKALFLKMDSRRRSAFVVHEAMIRLVQFDSTGLGRIDLRYKRRPYKIHPPSIQEMNQYFFGYKNERPALLDSSAEELINMAVKLLDVSPKRYITTRDQDKRAEASELVPVVRTGINSMYAILEDTRNTNDMTKSFSVQLLMRELRKSYEATHRAPKDWAVIEAQWFKRDLTKLSAPYLISMLIAEAPEMNQSLRAETEPVANDLLAQPGVLYHPEIQVDGPKIWGPSFFLTAQLSPQQIACALIASAEKVGFASKYSLDPKKLEDKIKYRTHPGWLPGDHRRITLTRISLEGIMNALEAAAQAR